ncbi:MAG TPA: hypothetical protein VFM02_03235 [Candidatus Paceibacterota bacterium]|nr:hypothetical protein [Candidatus Paceibacterota bacterium]
MYIISGLSSKPFFSVFGGFVLKCMFTGAKALLFLAVVLLVSASFFSYLLRDMFVSIKNR